MLYSHGKKHLLQKVKRLQQSVNCKTEMLQSHLRLIRKKQFGKPFLAMRGGWIISYIRIPAFLQVVGNAFSFEDFHQLNSIAYTVESNTTEETKFLFSFEEHLLLTDESFPCLRVSSKKMANISQNEIFFVKLEWI